MYTYFELIPNELINEIALYLDYQGTIKSRLILEEKYQKISGKPLIGYELLLLKKFPGIHRVVKIVIQNAINWKSYTYERAYNLMNLLELFIKNQIIENNYEKIRLNYYIKMTMVI